MMIMSPNCKIDLIIKEKAFHSFSEFDFTSMAITIAILTYMGREHTLAAQQPEKEA